MNVYDRARAFVDAQLAIDRKHGKKMPKLTKDEYEHLIQAVIRATPTPRRKSAA